MSTLLIKNIAEIATMQGPIPRTGKSMRDAGYIHDAAIYIENGKIAFIGPNSDAPLNADKIIDAEYCCVTPGLVDPHTHPVFAKTREAEFVMRLEGKQYMQIAEEGGGIMSSVRSLRDV
ncbi:imidazolonepropionase, partial [bacterium]|nr:imidazolonepropionase [bacterium]MBU1025629.1 imidazolonepropionase [bacterium]